MDKKQTGYVIQISARASGNSHETKFATADLRKGLDTATSRLNNISPGLGNAVGRGLREVVEGTKDLKVGVPHSASGKTEDGSSGTIRIEPMELV